MSLSFLKKFKNKLVFVFLIFNFILADPTNGCEIDDFSLYLTSNGEVFYNSSQTIAGFQFDVDGIQGNQNDSYLGSAFGGDAEEAGFTVSTGSFSGTVIGFSFTGTMIPAGCGTLTNLEMSGTVEGLSSIIISDSNGEGLDFTYYNFEEENDCESSFYDCLGICDGEAVEDCAGDCEGLAQLDECGVCNGDNSSCNDDDENNDDIDGFTLRVVDNDTVFDSNSEAAVIITLENEEEVAGFQFVVWDNPDVLSYVDIYGTDRTEGFTISANEGEAGVTLLGFSFNGATIAPGHGPILVLQYNTESVYNDTNIDLNISASILSDPNGTAIVHDTVNSILFLAGNGIGSDDGGDDGSCDDINDNGICDDEESFEENIVINEINYNPALSYDQEDADYEFIELYNNSLIDVDLSGWSLASTNIHFVFNHFILGVDEYVVLARNPETYEGSLGHHGTSLLNDGDHIILRNSHDDIVDSVTYSDGYQDNDHWPVEADAHGSTLELVSADLDNSIPQSWQASYVIPGGTPGFQNSVAPDPVAGCTDSDACNFNPEANTNDGSCEYPIENFDCSGVCLLEVDCNGDCGGIAIEDCEGICGGDTVEDCTGVCGGDAVVGGCDEVCESTAVEDCAGVCNGDAVEDCAGVCGGDAVVGGCDELCESTAVEDCAGVCNGDAVEDCAGDCNGEATYDDCDICGGNNSSCTGCLDDEALNYNPDSLIDCIDCCVYNEPSNFVVDLVETGESSLVIIQSALDLEIGDEVGLFDSNGIVETCDPSFGCEDVVLGEVLVGSGVWTGNQLEIVAVGSVNLTEFGGPALNGYVPENNMNIKVWKNSTDTEYNTNATFEVGNGTWGQILTVISSLEPVYTVIQTIELDPYQINMVSLNVHPHNMDMISMMNTLDMLLASNDQSDFYIPEYGVNQMDGFDITEGMNIVLNGTTSQTLSVEGFPVDMGEVVNLDPSTMNLLPYLMPHCMSTNDIFHAHDNHLLVVKNDDSEFYVPAFGVQTLTEMCPGESYALFLHGSDGLDFTYPTGAMSSNHSNHFVEDYKSRTRTNDVELTGESHLVLLSELSGEVAVGDQLRAYANGQMVGSINIVPEHLNGTHPVDLVAVGSVDLTEFAGPVLDGYISGDMIELRLFSVNKAVELKVSADLSDMQYGNTMELSTGTASVLNEGAIVTSLSLTQNYPNPFNPSTTISYNVDISGMVTLKVYDVMGRLVRTLVDGYKISGYESGYSVVWDGKDQQGQQVSAGLYIYSLQTPTGIKTKKMVLMK